MIMWEQSAIDAFGPAIVLGLTDSSEAVDKKPAGMPITGLKVIDPIGVEHQWAIASGPGGPLSAPILRPALQQGIWRASVLIRTIPVDHLEDVQRAGVDPRTRAGSRKRGPRLL